MNAEDKIKQLQKEIVYLKKIQQNCDHIWGNAEYDPDKVMIQDDRKGYEHHGVDNWVVPSFHEENKDRWSRKCETCGFKEYTYNQEIVIIKREPKF